MKITILATLTLAFLAACTPPPSTFQHPPAPPPVVLECEPWHEADRPLDVQVEFFRENSTRVTTGPLTQAQLWVCAFCEQIVALEVLGTTETNFYFQASVKRPRYP